MSRYIEMLLKLLGPATIQYLYASYSGLGLYTVNFFEAFDMRFPTDCLVSNQIAVSGA